MSPREIGVKLHVTDCQPINDGDYSSMNYFLAQVREKFEHEIFYHVNLLELKWCFEEEQDNGFVRFILERIEPDLVIILYPESFEQLEDRKLIKQHFEYILQKYFNTPETRSVIGVTEFKIQVYVNEEDVDNAIMEWRSNTVPVMYRLEDSGKYYFFNNHWTTVSSHFVTLHQYAFVTSLSGIEPWTYWLQATITHEF
ncbi:unnamed protein product [Trichobilharzia regenti]|nr:unnamed protein product [Trichobilharzia regenti]